MVATGDVTADGCVVFAKNSDREPGEAQVVELHPAREHELGANVRCTYIEIPQARRTHGVLLCRPHWMWGAEMGANDQGLVVGNEAVFTRAPMQEVGLLGMDLVRLVLERAASASEGVTVLSDLLEQHGQGGPAGHRDKSFRYHSSFLLADPEDAWVLETADRAWVAERVRGVRAISNGLTIRERWDRGQRHLRARARDLGVLRGGGPLDFAKTFSDPVMTRAAAAVRRRSCTEAYLRYGSGAITPRLAMLALRQHDGGELAEASGGVFSSVCAHASWWPTRRAGQTTGSLVSHIGGSAQTHFVTATAAPCTSVFKPLWLDAGLPHLGPVPRDRFDPRTLWWRHERLHRAALADLPAFLVDYGPERDAAERRFVRDASAANEAAASASERAEIAAEAFRASEALESRWLGRLEGKRQLPGMLYRRFWRSVDRASGLASAG